MYDFDTVWFKNFMAQHHYKPQSLERQFTLKHMNVSHRTISRWLSDKTLNQPNASQMRVLVDIAKKDDKSIKFEDFFEKKWVDSDKIG